LARSVASLRAWSLPHQGWLSSQGALAPCALSAEEDGIPY
jgi:hypothetical protein